MQIKLQVLAISAPETRKGANGNYVTRQLQCFLDQKVAVHSVNADPANADQMNALNALRDGYYMAELMPRAGNYGRLEFTIGKLEPVKP